MHMSVPSTGGQNLNGVDLSFTANLSQYLGVRGDGSYAYAGDSFQTGQHASLLSFLGGPVFYPRSYKRYTIYGQALFGGARISGAVPAASYSYWQGYVSRFAWGAGGGVQYRDSKALSFRLGVDYLHTSFIDSTAAIRGQSNARIVLSVVYVMGLRRNH